MIAVATAVSAAAAALAGVPAHTASLTINSDDNRILRSGMTCSVSVTFQGPRSSRWSMATPGTSTGAPARCGFGRRMPGGATTTSSSRPIIRPTSIGSGTVGTGCILEGVPGVIDVAVDGAPLTNLSFLGVVDALTPCQDIGLLRLRYEGKINAGFHALVERVAAIADRMEIGKRVLDIDSSGGQVEDAIKAGDAIGASGWTIWVREGASCHSACVLILGAGDVRMISGPVGIHRIIRMSSTATSRAQLNEELQAVYGRVKEYLARNGVAVAVADMMMAVPNRNLRLLSADELLEHGLDGTNPAQDDLDRLQLMRKCGEDFVRRRDAFQRNFDHFAVGRAENQSRRADDIALGIAEEVEDQTAEDDANGYQRLREDIRAPPEQGKQRGKQAQDGGPPAGQKGCVGGLRFRHHNLGGYGTGVRCIAAGRRAFSCRGVAVPHSPHRRAGRVHVLRFGVLCRSQNFQLRLQIGDLPIPRIELVQQNVELRLQRLQAIKQRLVLDTCGIWRRFFYPETRTVFRTGFRGALLGR